MTNTPFPRTPPASARHSAASAPFSVAGDAGAADAGAADAGVGGGRRGVWRSLSSVVMVVTVLVALGVVGARAFGVRTLVEQSESMAPVITTGDLIVSRDTPAVDAAPGEVITFPDVTRPGVTLTHRVVSVRRVGDVLVFDTQGDANTGHEQWTAGPRATIGRTVTVVPRAGTLLGWMTDPVVASVLTGLLVTTIVLLLTGGFRRRTPEPTEPAARQPAEPAAQQ